MFLLRSMNNHLNHIASADNILIAKQFVNSYVRFKTLSHDRCLAKYKFFRSFQLSRELKGPSP